MTDRREFLKLLASAAGGAALGAVSAESYDQLYEIQPLNQEISELEKQKASLASKLTQSEDQTQRLESRLSELRQQRSELLDAPEPVPVEASAQVAAFYVFGWGNDSMNRGDWRVGTPLHPLLGRYHSNDPWVADWHIKWALEHGIGTFFPLTFLEFTDSGQSGIHGFEEGMLHSRFFDQVKIALYLFWEPHWPGNPRGVADLETFYLLAQKTVHNLGNRHFARRNILKHENRPMLFLWSLSGFRYRYGDDAVRQLIDAIREGARSSGFEVYIIGDIMGTWHGEEFYEVVTEQVDAITAWNILDAGSAWPSTPYTTELVYGYDEYVKGYQRETRFWSGYAKKRGKGFVPPLSPGFSNRILYDKGIDNWLVELKDSSPEIFRKMCGNAKEFLDPDLNMVLIEAWNEIHESTALEPTMESGFGYLHALRDAFAVKPSIGWPGDVIPGQLYP